MREECFNLKLTRRRNLSCKKTHYCVTESYSLEQKQGKVEKIMEYNDIRENLI